MFPRNLHDVEKPHIAKGAIAALINGTENRRHQGNPTLSKYGHLGEYFLCRRVSGMMVSHDM